MQITFNEVKSNDSFHFTKPFTEKWSVEPWSSAFSQPIVGINELRPERLRPLLLSKAQQKLAAEEQQLMLDFKDWLIVFGTILSSKSYADYLWLGKSQANVRFSQRSRKRS